MCKIHQAAWYRLRCREPKTMGPSCCPPWIIRRALLHENEKKSCRIHPEALGCLYEAISPTKRREQDPALAAACYAGQSNTHFPYPYLSGTCPPFLKNTEKGRCVRRRTRVGSGPERCWRSARGARGESLIRRVPALCGAINTIRSPSVALVWYRQPPKLASCIFIPCLVQTRLVLKYGLNYAQLQVTSALQRVQELSVSMSMYVSGARVVK